MDILIALMNNISSPGNSSNYQFDVDAILDEQLSDSQI